MSKIKYPVGGYAPGHYTNKCNVCQTDFIGDKYAIECEPCAINKINSNYSDLYNKYIKLKNKVNKFKKYFNELINLSE